MPEPSGQGERRRKRRVRRRIPCELETVPGEHEKRARRFTGIVLDVSVDGLFVQTSAAVTAGTAVRVRVSATPQSPAMEFDAEVARAKRVPPQLLAAVAGGVGLHVPRPPAEFVLLQGGAADGAAASSTAAVPSLRAEEKPPTPTLPRFRVRLQQSAGNRSRAVLVEAADPAAARARALREAGSGWVVLEVEGA